MNREVILLTLEENQTMTIRKGLEMKTKTLIAIAASLVFRRYASSGFWPGDEVNSTTRAEAERK